MKKLILKSALLVLAGFSAVAAGPDEPFFNLRKFYGSANYGTARTQAMGGAFTALGADISNTYINPAGLGFYNRSEFSGTFNFNGNNASAEYIGTMAERSRSPLDLGQIGAVFSRSGIGSRKLKGNFGVSFNTMANFNKSYSFNGTNNSSSISDAFAEMANASGLTPEEIAADYDEYGNAPNNYAMAVMGGLLQYYDNEYYDPNEGIEGFPINQSGEVAESGSLGQLNLSYGANFDDKTYVGGSLGIQMLNFDRSTRFDEVFASNALYLNSQYYDNELSITGTGLNFTLGVIQRLNDHFNVGTSLTTPTLLWVTDSFQQYAGVNQKTSGSVLYDTDAKTAIDEFKYRITSPFKANVGVSAFLPNGLGVVSVEAEYLNFKGTNIRDKDDNSWTDSQQRHIRYEYKDVVNLKAGLELKKGIGRLRGGINLISDPLEYASEFNAKKNYAVGSVGLGIRNTNFFVDLSYSWYKRTSAYNPYWLSENSPFDYYTVSVKENINRVGVTIGTFF